MQKFETLEGIMAPMIRANIDTDMIIPKQFLRTIKRSGLGQHLFADLRYDENQNPLKDFILNGPPYSEAQILLAGANFGCGSSREHAVWALMDFGFKVVIAPSFAEIFYSNCLKNGLLPVKMPEDMVGSLARDAVIKERAGLRVDLATQTFTRYNGEAHAFDIDNVTKTILLEGRDEISDTLEHIETIEAYETQISLQQPWLSLRLKNNSQSATAE